MSVNPEKIYRDLVGLLGLDKVSNKKADLVSYSRDYWPFLLFKFVEGELPKLPSVVVFPKSTSDVAKIVRYAYEKEIPLYSYGGGTGVLGGAVPEEGGIVMDMKGLDWIVLHGENLYADVGAGVLGRVLEDYLEYHGYTLGHYPQSFYASTVGGWIGTKATGQFSTKYGGIEDMVLGLEVVLADGSVVEFPPYPRASLGPEAMRLFIGSEGALGVITRAYLKVWPKPQKRVLLSFGSKDLGSALDSVRRILWRGVRPAVIRVYDEIESKKWFHMVSGRGWKVGTIIVLEGDKEVVDFESRIVREEFRGAKDLGSKPAEYWLEHRFSVKEVSDFLPLGVVIDTIEVAVSWSRGVELYNRVIEAIRSVPGTLVAYAHASHFYPQGLCFYFIFGGAPEGDMTPEEYYFSVWDSVMRATMEIGGAISHHHGVGRWRMKWLEEAMGKEYLELLRKIKRGLDPRNILNRGLWGGEA